ncbi:hypothetical protein [uncultured Ligilactobacillus sp.]|uniref:hypothetical protein n=1 Tax=uncultured Ligilactobacillus sp. TaxID=2837633 RepID=UPI00272D73ED|nr:hypothetical protein [uncultured Ligilactobacillus sp.]
MKIKKRKSGYSAETAYDYIDVKKPVYSLSTELEEQNVFKDGKPTEEIDSYKAWFIQEDLPPFYVKFPNKIKLPEFLDVIEFDNLEACEIRYNVYFRAENVQSVGK